MLEVETRSKATNAEILLFSYLAENMYIEYCKTKLHQAHYDDAIKPQSVKIPQT